MGSERKTQPLVGMSVQFSREQREALQSIADARQLSTADVVREAVREYLAADAARRSQQVPVAA